MELGSATNAVLLVVAIGMALVAVLCSVLAIAGQRQVRATYRTLAGPRGKPREDVLDMVARHVDEVEALRAEVHRAQRHSEQVRKLVAGGISHVHVVRYDAFDDMGGRMSFSAALLDERGNGLVLTSINGRSESRTYAKGVRHGGARDLSDEEVRAISQALTGPGIGEDEVRTRRPKARAVRSAS
ncbi:MAG: DUF4446 family protein [Actinomycetota bacterium]|nr:DUF4446 family protein [Actinomycetota bacterium]